MLRVILLLVTLTFVASATQRYIVMYDNATWARGMHWSIRSKNTVRVLQNLKMVIADIPEGELNLYEALPGTTLVKDEEVHAYDGPSFVENNPLNWGIDRLDQKNLPLDQAYHFRVLAGGVNVYVVDTGVNAEHIEFGGRAVFDANFAGDGKDTDCNGHGTHCASTVAGTTVGVAKEAKIFGVKVLGCSGSGSTAGVISGIEHVVVRHIASSNKKTVISMSLGGGKNIAMNAAVEAAWLAGVTVVVAAGNENSDACNGSPASAPSVITVAASDSKDTSASFTNWGKCVNIYAPGVNIYAAWIGGTTMYKTISGTSMATPHVAGVAALLLGSGAATSPAQVKAQLVDNGSKDAIKNVPQDTPNVLLFHDAAASNSAIQL